MNDQVTKEKLLSAGYKEYKGSQHNHSDALFQKRIYGEEGIKYFINAWFYDWTKYDIDYSSPTSFSFEVQFTKKDGDHFNVSNLSSCTIEEHEEFFEDVWNNVSVSGYYDTQ